MSDLVKRLRGQWCKKEEDVLEAADRIEQLERELAEAREGWHVEMPNANTAWNDAIEAAASAITDAAWMAKECNCPDEMVDAISGMADLCRALRRPT